METGTATDNLRVLRRRPLANADLVPTLLNAPAVQQRIGLSTVETLSIKRLLSGDGVDEYVSVIVDRANSLATDDCARRRSLARAVAVAESMLQQCNLVLADALARRDAETAAMVDRALSSATRRFTQLVDALQVESNGGRRSVLVVGQAQQVNVRAA